MDDLDASKEHVHPLQGFVLPDPLPYLDGGHYPVPAVTAVLSVPAL